MGLTTQTRKFNVVINFPYDCNREEFLARLETYFKTDCEEYSYIVHNKDEKEDGELKTPHLHAVYIKDKRCRVITEINYLQKALGLEEIQRSLISCEALQYYERALRYLVHKDDIDKHQYKYEEVVSSLGAEFLKQLFDAEGDEYITIDYLLKMIDDNSGYLPNIYKELGLKNSMRYRSILLDLLKQRSADIFNEKCRKAKNTLLEQYTSTTETH